MPVHTAGVCLRPDRRHPIDCLRGAPSAIGSVRELPALDQVGRSLCVS